MFINDPELPRPEDIVEELPVVVSVVIRTVHLSMVGRSQGCHLMPVDGIVTEEKLHLLSNLKDRRIDTHLAYYFGREEAFDIMHGITRTTSNWLLRDFSVVRLN